jgi:hypothetical protein
MFDVAWYLKNNPELAEQNIEPLQHFCVSLPRST